MKLFVYGKLYKVFKNSQGDIISYRRVFGRKPGDLCEQSLQPNNIMVGFECKDYKCRESVIKDLPDDLSSYDGGLECVVGFDDKGYICDVCY